MEIDLAVIINEVERHGVRVAAIAQHGEHAAWRLLKQGESVMKPKTAKKPAAPDPADLNSLGNDLPALDLDEETLF